jgi:hypothetical protein
MKKCKTCPKELGFSDKINARSRDGDCTRSTTAERERKLYVCITVPS